MGVRGEYTLTWGMSIISIKRDKEANRECGLETPQTVAGRFRVGDREFIICLPVSQSIAFPSYLNHIYSIHNPHDPSQRLGINISTIICQSKGEVPLMY